MVNQDTAGKQNVLSLRLLPVSHLRVYASAFQSYSGRYKTRTCDLHDVNVAL